MISSLRPHRFCAALRETDATTRLLGLSADPRLCRTIEVLAAAVVAAVADPTTPEMASERYVWRSFPAIPLSPPLPSLPGCAFAQHTIGSHLDRFRSTLSPLLSSPFRRF